MNNEITNLEPLFHPFLDLKLDAYAESQAIIQIRDKIALSVWYQLWCQILIIREQDLER